MSIELTDLTPIGFEQFNQILGEENENCIRERNAESQESLFSSRWQKVYQECCRKKRAKVATELRIQVA